jgi:intracellular septation protein A
MEAMKQPALRSKPMNPMALFLTQLLPLIVFIVVDSFVTDVRISIIAAILFAVGQMAFVYARSRRFEWLILIDVGLIVALGGISIAFDNQIFFKVKPAIIEGVAIVFIAVLILAPGQFLLRYFGRMMPGMVLRPEALRMMKLMLGLICAGTAVHIGGVLYTAFCSSKEVWAFVSGPGFYIIILPIGVLPVIVMRARRRARR